MFEYLTRVGEDGKRRRREEEKTGRREDGKRREIKYREWRKD